MEAPDFVEGKYSTHFIEKNKDILHPDTDASEEEVDIAAITAFVDFINKQEKAKPTGNGNAEKNSWKEFGRRKGVLRL
jgi:acetyl-CoA carboxylase biotin carboxylase subunit